MSQTISDKVTELVFQARELVFWNELIAKYLTPLTQTKKEKADAAQGLKELRDSAAFSFLMINSIWVLTIYLLQRETDTLGLKWPIPTKVCKYIFPFCQL